MDKLELDQLYTVSPIHLNKDPDLEIFIHYDK